MEVTTNGAVPVATVDVITFAFAVPPIFISCPTPIPPVVVIAPVNVLTDAVEFVTFIAPAFKLP